MQQYFGVKKEGNKLFLEECDYNHIKNVMRLKMGDEVLVVYDGIQYICSLNSDYLSLNIIKEVDFLKESKDIIMYIPVTPEDKMDLVLEKCTELGVTRFIPTEYLHCKFKIKPEQKDKKVSRWNKIVRSASEQCHRLDIPIVEDIISYTDIKSNDGVNIVCSLDKENVKPLGLVLTENNVYDTITVVYGPEGGLSKEEEDFFESIGFDKVKLCSNVLRTETAAIFVCCIINYLKK